MRKRTRWARAAVPLGLALACVTLAIASPAGPAAAREQGAREQAVQEQTVQDEAAWLDPPAPLDIAAFFDRPESEWGPGHRGIDLWLEAGASVGSPGDGIVTFAGRVAGRGIVVVTHPSGLRSTLEPVSASVTVGQRISAGDEVGTLEQTGSHCAPRTCLHWGVRRNATYLDPLDCTRGYGPIRLLPLRE